jgi:hypothetical protein
VSRRDFLFASWLLLVSRQHPAACFLLSPQAKENKLLEKSDAFAFWTCTLFNPLRAAEAEKLSMGGDYYFSLPYCFFMVLQKQRC